MDEYEQKSQKLIANMYWMKLHIPDSKVHGANMGPTWVLSDPDGPHVGPMNLAIRDIIIWCSIHSV